MADIPKEEWPEPASERDGDCPADHECLADGRCRDDYGDYNPLAGSPEPVEGRCNALLDHWRSRYGEKRYCTQYPQTHFQNDLWDAPLEAHFCNHHSKRANVRMRAKEALQHGLFTKTREHLYDKLEPTDKLLCHALHESLLAESTFEFAEEFEEREFDFSESESVPDFADSDGTVTIKIPRATEHIDRSQILWCAAVDSMKMMKANAKIAEDEMERLSVTEAELTDDGRDGKEAFSVIEEREEHHLNLAYSRLVKDRKDLLSYGGVVTGTEADEEDSTIVLEDFTTIEADPEAVDGSGMLDIEADTTDKHD